MIPLLYGLLLIIGLILLWLSSDKAVLYASQAAGLFGISKLFVGFVLLAVSTGLPELLVLCCCRRDMSWPLALR